MYFPDGSPVNGRDKVRKGEKMSSRQLLLSKADTLTDTEVAEVLEYIGIMESLKEHSRYIGGYEDTLLAAWARSLMPRERNRQMRTPGVKSMGSLRV